MGIKFQQARETIHIAIELIDQYYLKMSQILTAEQFKDSLLPPAQVILHQTTCLLVASKYDEIDDNITAIRDLRVYVKKQLESQNKRDSSLIPTYDQIVACEKKILHYYEWDFKFFLPLHFVRCFLANGVLFANEFEDDLASRSRYDKTTQMNEVARTLQNEALSISDIIASKGNVQLRKEDPGAVAAGIIYLARKNVFTSGKYEKYPKVQSTWPPELVILTRCSEAQAQRALYGVLKRLDGRTAALSSSETKNQRRSTLRHNTTAETLSPEKLPLKSSIQI